jgi:hypothetical protein
MQKHDPFDRYGYGRNGGFGFACTVLQVLRSVLTTLQSGPVFQLLKDQLGRLVSFLLLPFLPATYSNFVVNTLSTHTRVLDFFSGNTAFGTQIFVALVSWRALQIEQKVRDSPSCYCLKLNSSCAGRF